MASLTGMQYLPPFTVFSARTAVEENRLSEHIRCWQVLLQALVNNDVNPKALAKHNTINGFICELKEAQQWQSILYKRLFIYVPLLLWCP